MKHALVRLLIFTATVVLFAGKVTGQSKVDTLLMKNNGSITAYIWVNDKYQGYVPAGRARYTLMEGFVTKKSGIQTDGSNKVEYSHGGWEPSGGAIKVKIKHIDLSSRRIYQTTTEVLPYSEGRGMIWFGENEAGSEPDSLVWEKASQIPSEKPPSIHNISQVYNSSAYVRKAKKEYPKGSHGRSK